MAEPVAAERAVSRNRALTVPPLSPRQPGATLAQQIADAQDTRAKIGDGPTSRVDDRARVTDTNRTIAGDPTLTHAPRPTHDEPTGRVIPGPVKPDRNRRPTAIRGSLP